MTLMLLTGVAGPLLDQFFLGGKLDRREIVATKAVCQIFGHAAKLIYFGALIDQAASVDPIVAALADRQLDDRHDARHAGARSDDRPAVPHWANASSRRSRATTWSMAVLMAVYVTSRERRPSAPPDSPSRAEIAAAVSMTCGMKVASAFFDSRLTGPASPIAATTSPASLRSGAAMQRMPSSLSSSSMAQPRARTPSSTFRSVVRIGDGLRRARRQARRAPRARPPRPAGTPGSPGPRRCNRRACARRRRSACGSPACFPD